MLGYTELSWARLAHASLRLKLTSKREWTDTHDFEVLVYCLQPVKLCLVSNISTNRAKLS